MNRDAKMNSNDEPIWVVIKTLTNDNKRDLSNIDEEYISNNLLKAIKFAMEKLIILSLLKKKSNIL